MYQRVKRDIPREIYLSGALGKKPDHVLALLSEESLSDSNFPEAA
jgi:hypothetical protein